MICQNSSFHKHPNFYNCCNVPVSATIVFTLKNKNKNNTRKFKILWLKLRELFLTVVFTKTPNVTVVFRLLSNSKPKIVFEIYSFNKNTKRDCCF